MKADVMELPLFPLSVVLFPGQTLPLHIFEPRYRLMIQRCIDNNQPFGVVLTEDSTDGQPHPIGTAARITQVERLPDGRMNIMTVGVERIALQNIYAGEDDYLIGDAIAYPFQQEQPPSDALLSQVKSRLKRYLALLAQLSGVKLQFEQYPTEPTAVAVFTAIAMQIPLEDKQFLLATEAVTDILTLELNLLSDEIHALSIMAASVKPADETKPFAFSIN